MIRSSFTSLRFSSIGLRSSSFGVRSSSNGVRSSSTGLLASLLGTFVLALLPVPALAEQTAATQGAPSSVAGEGSPSTGPSPSPPNTPTVSGEPTSTATTSEPTSTAPGGEPTSTAQAGETTTPRVQAQTQQAASGSARKHAKAHPHPAPTAEGTPSGGTPGGESAPAGNVHAPKPSALTPPLPSALGSALGGVPDFFIANFPLPPFLLPIYQAAGRAYGIPWQVLAAINEVETDYGRDLSISSAAAEGWMQFLPSTWAQYGVDANGDGFADPYNPADAIFAAARYLKAAGGGKHIREAIFAYNHSQSYVASVLLRAQLLHGTPPQLLSAIADLAEARFPVHAPSSFSDGFPTVPAQAGERTAPKPLVATAIDSTPGAPVIAVQDGTITAIGHSAKLGRYISLRDTYGNTYTYGQLGSVATMYPVLTPHVLAGRRGRIAEAGAGGRSAGAGKALPEATAGVQPRSPVSAGAVSSGLALGAAAALETASVPRIPTPLLRSRRARPAHLSSAAPRVFRAGHEDVSLHPLQVGSQVIAGTVIGHLGSADGGTGAPPAPTLPPANASAPAPASAGSSAPAAAATVSGPQASMIFQIRPNGVGAPLIDPKPILDGWVRLEGSLIYRATGKHRFPAAPPAAPASKAPKGAARLANVLTSTLTPGQWLQLTVRLGAIPDPVVAGGHSAASIPTVASISTPAKGKGNGNN